MLYSVEFSNSRSFRGLQDFNLARPTRAARASEQTWPMSSWNHGISTVAAIFGANAAGKSGLLRSLFSALKNAADDAPIDVMPFRADEGDGGRSLFDVRFEAPDFSDPSRTCEYHYRFESRSDIVLVEELRYYPDQAAKSQRVFRRERNSSTRAEGADYSYKWGFKGEKAFAVRLTDERTLFLGNTRRLTDNPLQPVVDWLDTGVNFYTARDYADELTRVTRRFDESPKFRADVVAYLRQADLGIVGLDVVRRSAEEIASIKAALEAQEIPQGIVDRTLERLSLELRFSHAAADGAFNLGQDLESDGTLAMLAFASIAIDALETGSLLVIDEIDSSLHPLLVRELVKQFASPETNPKQAQLVFTSHDLTLLYSPPWLEPLLDRDQIWLVEKDSTGASSVYSVAEFPVRNDENIFRKYLAGQYGSVPRPTFPSLGR